MQLTTKQQHYLSIILVLISYLLYTITMSCSKLLDQNLNIATIVFIRSLFTSIFLVPLLLDQGIKYYYTNRFWLHVLRVLFITASMLCTYYTYISIPLSLATSIGFTGPVIVTTFAALILKDRISIKQWLAIFIGYIGVLIIIQPVQLTVSAGIVTAIFSNVFAGLATIVMKLLTNTEQPKTILLYANTGVMLIIGLVTLLTWRSPSMQSWLLLMLMGALTMGSQACMVHAMRLNKPSVLAPFEYCRLLFAIPIGVYFFNEVISIWMLIGGLILIISNYYIVISNTKANLGE